MNGSKIKVDDHEEAGGYYDDLPGFRFHPTDEELVGFYLKRKVENKPPTIELIKQIDIYKYDPWDLPRVGNVGDNEWYFYCLRGRKYKNSIRPNRVTGHGFWKATGIDRPIYSLQGGRGTENCIGLKKSLVYYRGSAGKGTKTDWFMHEFRLPTDLANRGKNANIIPKHSQEAEVWTICRILKRAISCRKYAPDLSDDPSLFNGKRNPSTHDASSITSYSSHSVREIRVGCADGQFQVSNYMEPYTQEKPADINHVHTKNQSSVQASLTSSHCSNFPNALAGTIFHRNENWDELGAVVEFALHPSSLFGCS